MILGSDSLVSPFTSIINEWSRLFNLILHSKVNYDTLLLYRAIKQNDRIIKVFTEIPSVLLSNGTLSGSLKPH